MSAVLPSSLTILDAIRWATGYLQNSQIDQARLNAELIIGQAINMSRLDLYLKFDRPVDHQEIRALTERLDRRIAGEPLQYILGRAEFYGVTLHVDPSVLIPRPETERLVDHVKRFLAERVTDEAASSALQLDLFSRSSPGTASPVIADIGVGSGAITLALAHEIPNARLYATDISEEAVTVAQNNAQALNLTGRIRFFTGSFLDPLRSGGLVGLCDVIVSNPPYIRTGDIESLAVEIRDHEPLIALDGGADGLDAYRRIIAQAPEFLKPGGMLAMEIGFDQAESVENMLAEPATYRDIAVTRDYNRRNRVVSAIFCG